MTGEDRSHAPASPGTTTCDECGSSYTASTSQMAALCPECAHWLYGYPACPHDKAPGGRCRRCGWDGSVSPFVQGLRDRDGAE